MKVSEIIIGKDLELNIDAKFLNDDKKETTMLEILQPYISEIITAIVGALVAWFFTRKKQEMEV